MIIDGDFFEFLYHLGQTCSWINSDLQELYPAEHIHDNVRNVILVFFNSRKKIVDVSECSDFRMIAIEVLKHINGA